VLPLVVPPQPVKPRTIREADAATAKKPILEIFIIFLVFLESLTLNLLFARFSVENPLATEM
jgi:hypothetical protein